MGTDYSSYIYVKSGDGSFVPLCKSDGDIGDIPTLSDEDDGITLELGSQKVSFTCKLNKKETRNAIARLCGYHNFTHMKRPRMKRRWERRK